MSRVSVFLLGATGFLGGTVLTHLEGFDVVALVRKGKEGLMKGAKVVTGDFTHLDLIESTCATVDCVINAASSDDLPLTKAINRGLAKGRKAGKKGVLVHVSGTQLIESAPTGKYEDVPEYDDSNLEQMNSISELAFHRRIDQEIARADLAGEIVASIICPSMIYGTGSGPDKIISGLNPGLVKAAFKSKRAVYAVEGTNEWPNVHVDDVADLIVLSLKHNLEATEPAGFARFYFGENGKHSIKSLVQDLGEYLFSRKLVNSPEPYPVPVADAASPGWANATTVRCKATRGRAELGWTPRYTLDKDMLRKDWEDIVSELA